MRDKIINIIKHNPRGILNVCRTRKQFLIANGGKPEALSLSPKDFNYCYKLTIEEIKTRPDAEDRVGHWESVDEYGAYDYEVEQSIINMRRKLTAKPKNIDSENLKKLCAHRQIPAYFSKLYISELAQSNSSEDQRAINQAKILGLII